MNCAEVQERLSALLDGELRADERDAVERHVDECAKCDGERRVLAATIGGLEDICRELVADAPPAPVLDTIVTPRPRLPVFPFAVALAAAAAVFALVVFWLPNQSPRARLARVATNTVPPGSDLDLWIERDGESGGERLRVASGWRAFVYQRMDVFGPWSPDRPMCGSSSNRAWAWDPAKGTVTVQPMPFPKQIADVVGMSGAEWMLRRVAGEFIAGLASPAKSGRVEENPDGSFEVETERWFRATVLLDDAGARLRRVVFEGRARGTGAFRLSIEPHDAAGGDPRGWGYASFVPEGARVIEGEGLEESTRRVLESLGYMGY